MSVEQRTVYGITDEDGTYAEIALGVLGADGTMVVRAVLLVKFAEDSDRSETDSSEEKPESSENNSDEKKTAKDHVEESTNQNLRQKAGLHPQ